ncbi:hypothetical protein J6S88_01325 [bacterium]|nr:hypothetical protein [bacterium]
MLEAQFVDFVMTNPSFEYYGSLKSNFSTAEGSKSFYRFALKESQYPTLVLIDRLKDAEGNVIEPGYYELALTDMRDKFILLQSKVPIATMPVFKVEENISNKDEHNKKLQKIKKKQAKQREKINKKRAETGQTPDEEKINMSAEITYEKDGEYYLIKYERDKIRAWGAIISN